MPAARTLFWVATASVLAAGVAAAAAPAHVSVWAPLAALGAYVPIVLFGVLFPNLEMFADVVSRGGPSARGVALTFDDGPSAEHTPAVLELLERAGAKATFFVVGRKVEQHQDVVRAIAAAGHEVGVHGWAHDRLFSLRRPGPVRRDLERAIAAVESVTGKRPHLFRPPIGHTNAVIAAVARELGLTIVGWSARGLDGIASARSDDVARRVTRGLSDGVIVLLHDAAERDDHVPAVLGALPAILDAMEQRGLRGVALDEWIPGISRERSERRGEAEGRAKT